MVEWSRLDIIEPVQMKLNFKIAEFANIKNICFYCDITYDIPRIPSLIKNKLLIYIWPHVQCLRLLYYKAGLPESLLHKAWLW